MKYRPLHYNMNINSNAKNKKKNKEARKSNLELLRIVAMLLVLLTHYVSTRISIEEYPLVSNSVFNIPSFHSILNMELESLSFVCVNCFVLISGYFRIKFKWHSFANLFFQILFWSLFCILIASLPFLKFPDFPLLKTFITSLTWGWFVQGYIILFIFSPVLNAFIDSCSEKQLGTYVFIFYLLSTIGGYLMLWTDFHEGMSALSLMGIYLTGAYLKHTTLKIFSLKATYDLLFYLVGGVIMVCLNIAMLSVGIHISPYGYLNPMIILMSVFLFLFFKKTEIGHKRWVNRFAASAFSIYLFHCNVLIGPHISSMWSKINLQFSPLFSLFIAFISFVIIHTFCTLVDRLRIYCWHYVSTKVFNYDDSKVRL